jgi:ribosomal protein L11 methylase PrmA
LVSVLIAVPDEQERDFLLADLMEAGTLGCMEEPAGLRSFFSDENTAATIAAKYHALELRKEGTEPAPTAQQTPPDPVLVGRRFFIVTPSANKPTPDGRVRLDVEAGAAFGTGRHESTQLMLEVLEQTVRPGMTILDIGCGSGILSQAALLLGATHVAACDIDPVFLNALPLVLRDKAFVGSADAIQAAAADVVLANISAKVIDAIAYDLNRIVHPDGLLVLSGFIRDRIPQQFTPESETVLGDWLCWICKPKTEDFDWPSPAMTHSLHWY